MANSKENNLSSLRRKKGLVHKGEVLEIPSKKYRKYGVEVLAAIMDISFLARVWFR